MIKRLSVLSALLLAFVGVSATEEAVDFTGFWKSNCDDPFGTQIRPYGDGHYTLDFCGPGGDCDDPQDGAHATPIQGDPRFEVVSPTEIHEKEGDVVYGVLHKCTSDTHPELKYSEEDIAEGQRNFLIAIGIQAAYLSAALFACYLLWSKLKGRTFNRTLFLRCAVLAILFSPTMYYVFPFATPSFALLAICFQFYLAAHGTWIFLLPQIALSAISMLIVWLLLIGTVFAVRKLITAQSHERT